MFVCFSEIINYPMRFKPYLLPLNFIHLSVTDRVDDNSRQVAYVASEFLQLNQTKKSPKKNLEAFFKDLNQLKQIKH